MRTFAATFLFWTSVRDRHNPGAWTVVTIILIESALAVFVRHLSTFRISTTRKKLFESLASNN